MISFRLAQDFMDFGLKKVVVSESVPHYPHPPGDNVLASLAGLCYTLSVVKCNSGRALLHCNGSYSCNGV